MNILVINSNLLPYFLESKNIGTHSICCEDVMQDSSDTRDYDIFLGERLKEVFSKGKKFDLIVLPYSLNRDNLMEYSGLRLACHIRLNEDYKHKGIPILFMGPETTEEVTRFDQLGSLLYTSRVYSTIENEEEKFLSIVDYIFSFEFSCESLEADQYRNFLERVQIDAPSNYGSHHSVANEWAIMRWYKMFKWIGKAPVIKKGELSSMLYFKWLIEKETVFSGKREGYNERNAKTPSITSLPPRSRIIYIDDEGEKGWNSILDAILKKSDAELVPFTGFKKGLSKTELIKDIKLFLDQNPGNCFLIDLRLHDDDFKKEEEVSNLSGHIISRYIKDLNKGNQIVVFSASNKTWNYQIADEIGAVGYALKEAPEYNYSREESYHNFIHFSSLIRTACQKSYIRHYVEELRKYPDHPLLENFIDMLLVGEDKALRANVLNLAVFLESYLDGSTSNGKFRLEAGKLKMIQDSDQRNYVATYDTSTIILRKDLEEVKFLTKPAIPCPSDYQFIKESSGGSVSVILIALHYYYGLSESLCNLVLRLKNARNKSIAHYHGEESNISALDVRKIFECVVLKILEKDYPQH